MRCGYSSLNDKCAETNTLPTPLALIGSEAKLNEMGREEYIQRMIRREAISEWLRRKCSVFSNVGENI